MIDAVKEYLAWNTFGTVAYVCVIVHFLIGSVLIAVTVGIRGSENGRFSCTVDPKSTATAKKQIDQSCLSGYDQIYNSPVPLYGFVLLSIVSTLLVSVIYSLIVRNRVDEIKSSLEQTTTSGKSTWTRQENSVCFLLLFYSPRSACVTWHYVYSSSIPIFLSQWF